MKRKSPILHKVRAYQKKNKKAVASYTRGKGFEYNRNGRLANPTIGLSPSELEAKRAAARAELERQWYEKFSSDEVTDFEIEAVNDEGETVNINVYKSGENEDWYSADGNKYRSYMTPDDIMSSIRKDYEEAYITSIDNETKEEFIGD